MKHLGKIALAVLLTTAVSIPAFATSSGSSASGNANTSANANTNGANTNGANTTGANVGVGAGVGLGNTVGSTTQNDKGALGANLRANIDTSKARAPIGANVDAQGNVGASNNNTVGSTSNNTVGSTGTNARGAASSNETIGQRMNRHRFDSNTFKTSDADASGTLNYDEYVAYSGTTAAQAKTQTVFSKLDTDNNGFLSQAEIRARGEAEAGTRSTLQ